MTAVRTTPLCSTNDPRRKPHTTGKVAHDAFIGDAMAQADHEKEMRDMGDMHHGDGSEGVTVDAGKTGELTHTFDDASTWRSAAINRVTIRPA